VACRGIHIGVVLPECIQNLQGQSEVLGANEDKVGSLLGVPFEIFIECSTQKLHQFHQN